MRLAHDGVEFGLGELRRIHGVRLREHSARGARLDHVRSVLVRDAHGFARLLRAIDHALRRGSLREKPLAEALESVAMAPGGADGVHRNEHARPNHHSLADRIPQAYVELVIRPHVSHCRESRQQRLPRVHRGGNGHLRDGLLQSVNKFLPPVVGVGHGEVRVRVNESRHERRIAQIHHFGVRRNACARTRGGDFPVRNQHHAGAGHLSALPIEHPRRFDDRSFPRRARHFPTRRQNNQKCAHQKINSPHRLFPHRFAFSSLRVASLFRRTRNHICRARKVKRRQRGAA